MYTTAHVITLTMKLALLLSILTTTIAEESPQWRPHYVSVCNHASEPTFGEIFSFASPIDPDNLADMACSVSEVLPEVPQGDSNSKEKHHWMLVRAFQELVAWAVEAVAEVLLLSSCL